MSAGAPPSRRVGRRELLLAALLALLAAAWTTRGAAFRPGGLFFAVDSASAFLPWAAELDGPVENPALSDQAVCIYPFNRWVSESWRSGDPPTWCPLVYAGAPGFGNAQAGALDPQVLLPVALEALGGKRLFDWGLGLVAWLRVAAALLGAHLLARRLGLARAPAALAASAFGLSGYLTLWLNHPLGHVPPLFPWVLLGLEGIRGARPTRAMAGSALALALAILGGHAETAFFVGAASGAWALAILREDRRAGARALVALALGSAAAAASLVPLTEYLNLSAAQAVRAAQAQSVRAEVDLLALAALLLAGGAVWAFARRPDGEPGREPGREPGCEPGCEPGREDGDGAMARGALPAALGALLALVAAAFFFHGRGWGLSASLALVHDRLGAPGPDDAYRGARNYVEMASAWLPFPVLLLALAGLLSRRGPLRRRGLVAALGTFPFLLAIELPGLHDLYRFVPVVGLGDTVRLASVSSLMLGLLAGDALAAAPRLARVVAVGVLLPLVAASLVGGGPRELAADVATEPEADELVGFALVPGAEIDGVDSPLEGYWHPELRVSAARARLEPLGPGGELAGPAVQLVALELHDGPSAEARERAADVVAAAPEGAVWFRGRLLTALLADGHWRTSLELVGSEPGPAGRVAERLVRVSTVRRSLERRPGTLLPIAASVLFALLGSRRLRSAPFAWGLVLVSVGAGLRFADGANPFVAREDVFPATRTEAILARELGAHRFFADVGVLPPDTGLVRGLRGIEGYDAMDPLAFNEYLTYVLPPEVNGLLAWNPRGVDLDLPTFRLLGVKLLVLREPLRPGEERAGGGWELVASPDHREEELWAETWIYRARDPLPRAFCVPRVGTLDELGALERSDPHAWDPLAFASYDGEWRPRDPFREGRVGEPRISNARVELVAELDGDGLLVLTDQMFPGWSVEVDGEPAELGTANMIFRGVPLAAGRHEVVFRYAPASIRLGVWGSLAAALGILWLALRPVSGAAGGTPQRTAG